MSPILRLRLLCAAAAMLHVLAFLLLVVDHWPAAALPGTFAVELIITLAALFGVAILFRPARLVFPVATFFQFGMIASANPIHSAVAVPAVLLGAAVSLSIAVLIFTSPTKQLFFPIDPDAPVR